MKRYLPLTLLILTALACNAVGLLPGGDDPAFPEDIDPQSLTATLMALDTVIAQTTAEAAAQLAPTETPAPDSGNFCDIYAEFVNDLNRRVDEYSAAVAVDGDAHSIAVEADEAIEVYMDRLAPVAPEEIRPETEALANMSLIGLLSSQDQIPEAEFFLAAVDDYATDNCEISFNE